MLMLARSGSVREPRSVSTQGQNCCYVVAGGELAHTMLQVNSTQHGMK